MTQKNTSSQQYPAQFSTLILSLASSAILAMGLEKNPQTNQYEKNIDVARFNIDMLLMLKEKTKNNLDTDEHKFLETLIGDLQMKFVYANQSGDKTT